MDQVVLYDKEVKDNLFPFSCIRHVARIRIGILTIHEKWEMLLNQRVPLISESGSAGINSIVIAANIVPSEDLVSGMMEKNEASYSAPGACRILQYPWHIVQWNDWALRQDFALVTSERKSAPIPDSVRATNPDNIFIEEGAILSHCVLNASEGPVYIGKNAEIMEGATIRGPFALCEGAVVKMGARIYGATTIGPFSTVGGEIKNSVVFGYSNKAHDGYLGDTVIGEWCNLGAGSSNSNLKNNVGEVKVWNPGSQNFINAGTKCGLLLGDYSRSAINTAFNTGTIVGICANVFCEGLTPTFIPDFSWGTRPFKKYEFAKAVRDIENWKKLKGKSVSDEEIIQLRNIFNQS